MKRGGQKAVKIKAIINMIVSAKVKLSFEDGSFSILGNSALLLDIISLSVLSEGSVFCLLSVSSLHTLLQTNAKNRAPNDGKNTPLSVPLTMYPTQVPLHQTLCNIFKIFFKTLLRSL